MPLQIVPSPFREVTSKLVQVIERVQAEQPRCDLTVMLPEVIPHRWWEEPLHNQTAFALELALRYHSGIVVTTVPSGSGDSPESRIAMRGTIPVRAPGGRHGLGRTMTMLSGAVCA